MKLQQQMFQAMHESHIDKGKIKACSRKLFFRLGTSADVKKHVAGCRMSNRIAPPIPHPVPTLTFEKMEDDILEFANSVINAFKTIICHFFHTNASALQQIMSFNSPRLVLTTTSQLHGRKMRNVEAGKQYWLSLMEYRNTSMTGLHTVINPNEPSGENKNTGVYQLTFPYGITKDKGTPRFKTVEGYDKSDKRKIPEFWKYQQVTEQKGRVWEQATILEKHKANRLYVIAETGTILRRNTKHLRASSMICIVKIMVCITTRTRWRTTVATKTVQPSAGREYNKQEIHVSLLKRV
ncbi:hypothetical protein PR048_011208 [Dryococelus australis]|uniref:Uncharacterized protein n=1 Tax=Dryococelus australis TaxID=614101 RepID=A0ABQ9HKZ3_9NEOP|nr:hypothetical protein PR048_011208 [Dryococelus australis]